MVDGLLEVISVAIALAMLISEIVRCGEIFTLKDTHSRDMRKLVFLSWVAGLLTVGIILQIIEMETKQEDIAAAQRVMGGTLEMTDSRPCRLCNEMIIFSKHEGKTMVFDAEPYKAWYLKDGEATPFPAMQPHQLTCPKYSGREERRNEE